MHDFLFEVGCEELPPSLIFNINEQIKNNIINKLSEKDIPVNNTQIKTYCSPRRLAILIKGLPKEQEAKKVEIRGPSKESAFDKTGKPTNAAIGFAKKNNVEITSLKVKTLNNIDYIFAETTTGGISINKLLSIILPESLEKVSTEKLMKWGTSTKKFVRPIRWLLAIIGSETICFNYDNLRSSNFTFGHRFISNKKINISSPLEYEEILSKNHILVNSEKRKNKILSLISGEAKKVGGLPMDGYENLLETVTNITEYPQALLCSFETRFLELPQIITKTVLEKHQKYFVLQKEDKSNLLPNFIVITNGSELNNETVKNTIKKGNEKVAKARLNDAEFFFKEDLKIPFTHEARIKSLSKISFQKGLGSMEEKVERIIRLSKYIYESINKEKSLPFSEEQILTTAKLCKLDLTTKLVFEMPELQGYIGSIYAKLNKYPEIIYKGIQEHYTGTNSISGFIVGLADKLDNLICLFSIGKIPNGSQDPFGLRSQSQWIFNCIELIWGEYKATIDLSDLINHFAEKVSTNELRKKVTKETIAEVKKFLLERLKLLIKNKYEYNQDHIEAVCSVGDSISNIPHALNKIDLLNKRFTKPSESDKAFLIAAKRLIRIVDINTNGTLNALDLTTEQEKILFNKVNEINSKRCNSHHELLNELAKLTEAINNFFDKVLVNDPDPKIKQARQPLLKNGKNLFEKICDFNKIQEL